MSEHLGLHRLAIAHKTAVEQLVARRPIFKGGYPALTDAEWKMYEALPTRPSPSIKSRKRVASQSHLKHQQQR